MDRRTRELERQWRASGDIHHHAAFLRALSRTKNIQNNIEVAAYLGHKTCELIVPHLIKPGGFIKDDHLLRNEEIRDYIYWLHKWGRPITWRATLGVARLVHINLTDNSSAKLICALNRYVEENASADAKKHLDTMSLQYGGYDIYQFPIGTRQQTLTRRLYFLTRGVLYANGLAGIRIAAADFPDKQIKKAIRGELYPFLLGAYQ